MTKKKRASASTPKSPLQRESLSGEEWIQDLRMRIHRRTQDPNSIGIHAAYDGSNKLEGSWRFLNRSKILPQPFSYTQTPKGDSIPTASDGPTKWHPTCGVNGVDRWKSRGLSDGLGCSDEEDTSLLHPVLFGSVGGSNKA